MVLTKKKKNVISRSHCQWSRVRIPTMRSHHLDLNWSTTQSTYLNWSTTRSTYSNVLLYGFLCDARNSAPPIVLRQCFLRKGKLTRRRTHRGRFMGVFTRRRCLSSVCRRSLEQLIGAAGFFWAVNSAQDKLSAESNTRKKPSVERRRQSCQNIYKVPLRDMPREVARGRMENHTACIRYNITTF